ncbi:hypothetical protein V2J09_023379 [Rumex salicifolius]
MLKSYKPLLNRHLSVPDSDTESDDMAEKFDGPKRVKEGKCCSRVVKSEAEKEEIGREAKAYQEYMEKLAVPEFNETFDAEYNTWEELSKIMEEFYKQPLHYLTITTLKQWDKQRIGTKEENKPLDDIIHLLQAEPTIWYVESVNRLTASSDYLRELWISDPKYREFARVPNGS